MMYCWSKQELALRPRMRLLQQDSSNQMDHIGPLITTDPTDLDEEWNLPIFHKHTLLGDTRREGGGAGSEKHAEAAQKKN